MQNKQLLLWPCVLACFWLWVITPSKFMGSINPVIEQVEISSTSIPGNDEWVGISGSFVKLRDTCRPLYIDWILGTRLNPGPPVEYVWGKPEIRLMGEQVFEFWLVRAAPPTVFENGTFADVIHKCGIIIPNPFVSYDSLLSEEENQNNMNWRIEFPWETRSQFWN